MRIQIDSLNTGYNLKDEPEIFDLIYTGTETRDPFFNQQHLQSYLSYFIMRYLSNIGKGKNLGGWFDNFDCPNPQNYIQQASLTLFAKASEVTLFCYSSLKGSLHLPLAGHAFGEADSFLAELGNPFGTACYKPFHSSGEDHLYDYIGMLGIPLEPVAEFPVEKEVILLTASAAQDGYIMEKIRGQLAAGKTVVVTSGLFKRLQGRGVEDLGGLVFTERKIGVQTFGNGLHHGAYRDYAVTDKPVTFPVLDYFTNDYWADIAGFVGEYNAPVLLSAHCGPGRFYVWVMPDGYADLYRLPRESVNILRDVLAGKNPLVSLDAKPGIGLFTYDNGTFIVHSFLSHYTEVRLKTKNTAGELTDLQSKKKLPATHASPDRKTAFFEINLSPYSYRVFRSGKS